jgi:hypothetical protein
MYITQVPELQKFIRPNFLTLFAYREHRFQFLIFRINIYSIRPPLWSNRVPGYRSRGHGFDSRLYQIFWEVVSLERGPLSIVSTIEQLLVIIGHHYIYSILKMEAASFFEISVAYGLQGLKTRKIIPNSPRFISLTIYVNVSSLPQLTSILLSVFMKSFKIYNSCSFSSNQKYFLMFNIEMVRIRVTGA